LKELFHNRNYMFYWFSSAFTMAASNIVQFMLSLYVLDTTGSATLFATMLSITIFPRLLFSPIAGVFGDRFDRRNWMFFLGLCSGVTIALFGILHESGIILTIWIIYVLVILLETFETFYSSSSVGIIPLIVKKEEIGVATSFADIDEGIVGIIGPLLAATFYATIGVGVGLIMAGVISFLGSVLLLFMHTQDIKDGEENVKNTIWKDFLDGVNLVKKEPFLRKLVILAPLTNFFLTSAFNISLVFFLRNKLNVSDIVFGGYEAILSVMVLIAPFIAMKLLKKEDAANLLPPLIFGITIGFTVLATIVIFNYFQILGQLSTIIILCIASGIIVSIIEIMNIASSVMFKTLVSIKFLGRVISIVNLLATISIPLGQMIYGIMNDFYPIYWTLILSAGGFFLMYFLSASILKDIAKPKE